MTSWSPTARAPRAATSASRRGTTTPSASRPRSVSLDAILAGLDVLSATTGTDARQQPRPDARRNGHRTSRPARGPRFDLATRAMDRASPARPTCGGDTSRLRARPTARLAGPAPAPEAVKKKPLSAENEPQAHEVRPHRPPRVDFDQRGLTLWPEVVAHSRQHAGERTGEGRSVPAIVGPNAHSISLSRRAYTQAKEFVDEAGSAGAGGRSHSPRDRKAVESCESRSTPRAAPLVMELRRQCLVPAKPKAMPPRRRPRSYHVVRRALDLLGATIQRVDEGIRAGTECRTTTTGVEPCSTCSRISVRWATC